MQNAHQPKRIKYIPPTAGQLEDYAYDVCEGLGSDYTDPEVMSGFAGFIRLAVSILARHANASGGFDNDR